ncbi:MAG: 2-dehydropantoate 2-reductase [Deltaproteobacteria bacterium]|nr:2-dehydropantoate 2-reductase [Deltaproteobacteria bacterium]
MVAVKHHHLPKAVEDIRHRVGEKTLILSVMNGIDSEAALGAKYGMEKILYAVAVGIDAVRIDNRLTYSTQGKLLFGEATNDGVSERVRRVQSLFERAGIHYETPRDMRRMLWWKFMINVGMNQASALLRANYSEFVRSKEAKNLMESAMREVITIARKKGVDLNENDIDAWNEILSANMSSEGKTSMLQDVEARRKTEVEMLAGKVIELGQHYGVPTPVNKKLFKAIKRIEAGNGIAAE